MKTTLIFCCSFLLFTSCSMNKMVIRQMEPILNGSIEALYEESDLVLAEQAMAANLKLVEGILKSDPNNRELLLMAAQGYAGYALGFLEDEHPQRAKTMYLRGRNYALRILRKDKQFVQAEKNGLDALQAYLTTRSKKDVPELFWAGFAWAGYINLSLDNPAALTGLPKVQLLMDRVKELDAPFFNGAVYLFLGSVYGMKPRIMGGDPQKAGQFFKQNFELTDQRFLLAHLYAAKYFAAKTLDEEQFDKYIQYIEAADINILPGMQLMTQIAKKKARHLKSLKEELF